MAEHNPTGRDRPEPDSPAGGDAKEERAILDFLLDEHPAQVTLSELSLALNGEAEDFRRGDAIRRAVRELVGAGLLHRAGPFVLPSRAALYLAQLEAA